MRERPPPPAVGGLKRRPKAMIANPLDLDAIKDRIAYFPSTGRVSRDEATVMIAVIEALRAALERVPETPHVGMCQFRPPYSQLGLRPCTCHVGKVQDALALVTGGR